MDSLLIKQKEISQKIVCETTCSEIFEMINRLTDEEKRFLGCENCESFNLIKLRPN